LLGPPLPRAHDTKVRHITLEKRMFRARRALERRRSGAHEEGRRDEAAVPA